MSCNSDLDPIADAMSYYMNGRLGWIFGVGLVAFGVGSLCIAYGLRVRLVSTKQWFGSVLFVLWGSGGVIGGLFPPDPRGHWDAPISASGLIHGGAAMVALITFPPAALVMLRQITRSPVDFGPTRLLGPLAWSSAASLCTFFSASARPYLGEPASLFLGLVERILITVYMTSISRSAWAPLSPREMR